MRAKITSSSWWTNYHNQILAGENIPREEENGYKVTSYLREKSYYKHPTLDQYYIPEDAVTLKYINPADFEELDSSWFPNEDE